MIALAFVRKRTWDLVFGKTLHHVCCISPSPHFYFLINKKRNLLKGKAFDVYLLLKERREEKEIKAEMSSSYIREIFTLKHQNI